MTNSEIRQILQTLPADSPFFDRSILGRTSPATAFQDRLDIAYFELNIGWMLAKLYHQAEEPLPAFIEQASIRRCYYHVSGIPDPAISEARFLDETNTTQARLARAMLFDRGSSYESIADYLKLSDEIVRLNAELLFNVHDRLDDPISVAHHLYPETRAVHLMPDYVQQESAEWIMRRLAYENGWRAVAQFAGTEPLDDSSQSIDKQAEALERLAISNGMLFARAGCLNSKESPAIQNARTMVAARRKATGNRPESEINDPLMQLSFNPDFSKLFRKTVTEDALKRLQFDRGAEQGGGVPE